MRQGDTNAISQLVSRYFGKISAFAESKLRRGVHITDDGEDIAITVLQTITECTAQGRYPDLQDRNDLWLLMIVIAQHAVIDRQRSVMNRTPMHSMTDILESYNLKLDAFLGKEDSESKAMEIFECWEKLLKSLPDEASREIAKLKLQGHSNRKIGDILRSSYRTVDRKVNNIAKQWHEQNSEPFGD